MSKSPIIETFTLPAFWMNPLMYSDYTGLEEEEHIELDNWYENERGKWEEFYCADVQNDGDLDVNDANGNFGEVGRFTFVVGYEEHNHRLTPNIVCPWCGVEHDPTDNSIDGHYEGVQACDDCHKVFAYKANVEITWITEKSSADLPLGYQGNRTSGDTPVFKRPSA